MPASFILGGGVLFRPFFCGGSGVKIASIIVAVRECKKGGESVRWAGAWGLQGRRGGCQWPRILIERKTFERVGENGCCVL